LSIPLALSALGAADESASATAELTKLHDGSLNSLAQNVSQLVTDTKTATSAGEDFPLKSQSLNISEWVGVADGLEKGFKHLPPSTKKPLRLADVAKAIEGKVKTLFPEETAKNFSEYGNVAKEATYKLNSVFPASKGQLEADNQALLAKNAQLDAKNAQQDAKSAQQDTIIYKLVQQINSLTPVSVPSNSPEQVASPSFFLNGLRKLLYL
jgi:hypothetical protein